MELTIHGANPATSSVLTTGTAIAMAGTLAIAVAIRAIVSRCLRRPLEALRSAEATLGDDAWTAQPHRQQAAFDRLKAHRVAEDHTKRLLEGTDGAALLAEHEQAEMRQREAIAEPSRTYVAAALGDDASSASPYLQGAILRRIEGRITANAAALAATEGALDSLSPEQRVALLEEQRQAKLQIIQEAASIRLAYTLQDLHPDAFERQVERDLGELEAQRLDAEERLAAAAAPPRPYTGHDTAIAHRVEIIDRLQAQLASQRDASTEPTAAELQAIVNAADRKKEEDDAALARAIAAEPEAREQPAPVATGSTTRALPPASFVDRR